MTAAQSLTEMKTFAGQMHFLNSDSKPAVCVSQLAPCSMLLLTHGTENAQSKPRAPHFQRRDPLLSCYIFFATSTLYCTTCSHLICSMMQPLAGDLEPI